MSSDESKGSDGIKVGVNIDTTGLGAFSVPAETLAKTLRDFVNFRIDPDKVIEFAKARGEAKVIRARTDIRIQKLKRSDKSDLLKAAKQRQQNIMIREELNVQEILDITLENMSQPPHEKQDHDWLHQFFVDAPQIGDPDLQQIWGKMLAGQLETPGKYSLLTLSRVKTMRKKEAELFTEILQRVWKFDGQYALLTNEYSYETQDYEFVMNMNDILWLESHGLVQRRNRSGIDLSCVEILEYFGKKYALKSGLSPDEPFYITTDVHLTQVGYELLDIAGAVPDDDIRDQLISDLEVHFYAYVTPM